MRGRFAGESLDAVEWANEENVASGVCGISGVVRFRGRGNGGADSTTRTSDEAGGVCVR